MNITFRQLRLFLALAETGSVSAAARCMHVTQPTASMQLREVTLAVGMPLYEVVSRRVHLTEAGQALARTARAIAGEWDAFEQRVAGAKGLTSGRLKVAVVSTAKYFIPRLLGSFCKLHPQIDISLEILNRDHVITRLRSNLDDLYVMSVPPADLPLEDQILMPNPLVVIAAATHPLALKKRVTLAQLQGERFILREKGSGTRMATDAHLRLQGFAPTAEATRPSRNPSRANWAFPSCPGIRWARTTRVWRFCMCRAFPSSRSGTWSGPGASNCHRSPRCFSGTC